MSQNLHNTLSDLPQFLSSHHLVELGLYPSLDAVYLARVRGHSPDFIKLKRKVLYPKNSVLQFIEQRMKKGGSSGSDSDSPQQGQ
ncbi:MAG: hypothetical protein NTX86_02355 [Candidatus Dependentiae bacterium]|nr:hypothetical protein [Candidatus Dependentiae bacterium]